MALKVGLVPMEATIKKTKNPKFGLFLHSNFQHFQLHRWHEAVEPRRPQDLVGLRQKI